jgi:hypothetical protein
MHMPLTAVPMNIGFREEEILIDFLLKASDKCVWFIACLRKIFFLTTKLG